MKSKTLSVTTSASMMLPSRELWSVANLNDVSSTDISLVLVVVVSYLEALLSVVLSNGPRLRGGFEVMFSVWQNVESRAKLNNK